MKEFIYETWFNTKVIFKKETYEPKVFCIGYNKTGTTTVGKALELLGYDNSSFNKRVWRKLYKKGKIEEVLKYTAKFESFDDLPWLKEDMIPLLDSRFPHSKFIYLSREEEAWKKSLKNWSKKIFDKDVNVESRWNEYLSHQKFVTDFFKKRPSDIIFLTVKDPEGFKKLADFLGKEAPHNHFPHFNKT